MASIYSTVTITSLGSNADFDATAAELYSKFTYAFLDGRKKILKGERGLSFWNESEHDSYVRYLEKKGIEYKVELSKEGQEIQDRREALLLERQARVKEWEACLLWKKSLPADQQRMIDILCQESAGNIQI